VFHIRRGIKLQQEVEEEDWDSAHFHTALMGLDVSALHLQLQAKCLKKKTTKAVHRSKTKKEKISDARV